MNEWNLFEIILSVLVTAGGAPIRMVFTRTDRLERRIATLETRTAVVQERTVEIFHRLERIESKLDQLLTKDKK